MATKKELIAALEDAGHEKPKLNYKSAPRGYYLKQGDEWVLLGENIKAALKTVAAMPDPNDVHVATPGKVNAETAPKIYGPQFDDFGNPIKSPF